MMKVLKIIEWQAFTSAVRD